MIKGVPLAEQIYFFCRRVSIQMMERAMGRVSMPMFFYTLLLCRCSGVLAGQACEPVGSPILGARELKKIKKSLGRINDEVHAILGVLDDFDLDVLPEENSQLISSALQSISSLQSVWPTESMSNLGRSLKEKWSPTEMPVENSSVEKAESVENIFERWAWLKDYATKMSGKLWQISQKCFSGGLFILDISVVIAMMLFLESIGRKPRRLARAAARRLAADAAKADAPGTPIPAPTGSAGRESSQWLAWLSQEELLAACLKEHSFKFILGLLLALSLRLLPRLLSSETLLFHLLLNLSVTLRCVGLALVLLQPRLAPTAQEVARETQEVLAERNARK